MNKKIAKKSKETSIDDLAVMVQNGFLELKKELKTDMSELKKELKTDISKVKSAIEDVKVGLNQRVHIFDYKDLEFRVEKMEEKVRIGKRK